VSGGYESSFMALVVQWYINKGHIENHVADAQAKAAKRQSKRGR